MAPPRPPRAGRTYWPLPPIAEQLLVGMVWAALAAVAEVVVCVVRTRGQVTSTTAQLVAAAHILALVLPVGLCAGAVLGVLLAWSRRLAWLGPLRSALWPPREWFRQRPRVFAWIVVAGGASLGLFAGAQRAVLWVPTRFVRADYGAAAAAAAVLALVPVAFLVALALTSMLRPILRRIGRLASLGSGISTLALVGAAGATVFYLRVDLGLLRALPMVEAWFLAAAPAALGLAVLLVRLTLWGVSRRTVRRAAALGTGIVVAALGASSVTYGKMSSARSVVEGRGVFARRLLRGYLRASDLDGDGHSWAFGGSDCDDRNPNVHPGALDLPGDGVDADCFEGDGGRDRSDLGDGRYGTPPADMPEQPNFLIFLADALRPDHLGVAGYRRPTSPNIDAFARGAARFANAHAQSTRTHFSFPSMMTGLYPSQVRYGDEHVFRSVALDNDLLPEVLKRHGYATRAFVGTNYFGRLRGFFQGFDAVTEGHALQPPREEAIDQAVAALRSLSAGPRPWLLYLHYFDLHADYLFDGHPSSFGGQLVDKYDTEIQLLDRQFQRVLDAVDELGLRSNTVIILLSDHGESFGEHGIYYHAHTLYDEEARATLMLAGPGIRPSVVTEPVPLIDLVPTILNLARIPLPRRLPARSLVPALVGQPLPVDERVLYAELLPDGVSDNDLKSVRTGSEKLIWNLQTDAVELFELTTDPGEQRNIADDRPDRTRALLGGLRAWVAQATRPELRIDQMLQAARLEAVPARMTRRMDVRYPGKLTFLGFDLPRTRFRAGETVELTFYFRADSEMEEDLFIRADFVGPPGFPAYAFFHAQHYPIYGRYHTYEWQPGEVLRDPVFVPIPPSAPRPSKITVTFQLMTVRSGRFVPVSYPGDARGDGRIDLAEFEIR